MQLEQLSFILSHLTSFSPNAGILIFTSSLFLLVLSSLYVNMHILVWLVSDLYINVILSISLCCVPLFDFFKN